MPIKILFFGSTAEIIGKREIEIELTSSSKAERVFEGLIAEYPRLVAHSLLFSINQQYATGEEILKDGDELAIFTAVSGG
ncbi:MAG: MoaD/ThiS family protein [Pyrinomonadaceae bacterium]